MLAVEPNGRPRPGRARRKVLTKADDPEGMGHAQSWSRAAARAENDAALAYSQLSAEPDG